jgi:hypothetical protein
MDGWRGQGQSLSEFLEGLARFRDLYPGSILTESENENFFRYTFQLLFTFLN